ncbi:MAG: glucokinase [Gammaproteobacteria bacterium]|nr:glucokinase [Gammaproteobacteria bacterium]
MAIHYFIKKNADSSVLVADIGGSNARLGLSCSGVLSDELVFPCAEFDGVESLIEHYFLETNLTAKNAVIAVAATVLSDDVVFTNSNWQFSIPKITRRFGFSQLQVLNDFSALALSIPLLSSDQKRRIHTGKIDNTVEKKETTKGLIGAGTGLGVSGLIPSVNGWFPIQGEGGHVRYGPMGEKENNLFPIISPSTSYLSAESLLCGAGLLRLYKGLATLNGVNSIWEAPADVVAHGINSSDALCHETLDLYCGIFGDVAGNLALTLGASGGIYIGGGVANHMPDFFCQSNTFRNRFEDRGAHTKMVSRIPTFLISDTNAALIGASVAYQSPHLKIGITHSGI